MRDWIKQYISRNGAVDACDSSFHNEFHEKFGGKRKMYNWGASPVYKAMRLLKKMYVEGELDRKIVSLGENWQRGFPKWVYGYELPISKE